MLKKSGLTFTFGGKRREGVQDFETEIFPNHFLGLICGKPGSGKTSLLKFLLMSEHFFYKKFDYVFIMSPSFTEYKCLYLPQDNFTGELNYEFMAEKLKEVEKDQSGYRNVLFVIDDLVSELAKSKKAKEIIAFIFNRRHLLNNGMISILMTSQKYNFIPPFIRVNLNMIIIFKLTNKEMENIQKELVFERTELEYVTRMLNPGEGEREAGRFIIYNVDKNKYYFNFDEVLFKPASQLGTQAC